MRHARIIPLTLDPADQRRQVVRDSYGCWHPAFKTFKTFKKFMGGKGLLGLLGSLVEILGVGSGLPPGVGVFGDVGEGLEGSGRL